MPSNSRYLCGGWIAYAEGDRFLFLLGLAVLQSFARAHYGFGRGVSALAVFVRACVGTNSTSCCGGARTQRRMLGPIGFTREARLAAAVQERAFARWRSRSGGPAVLLVSAVREPSHCFPEEWRRHREVRQLRRQRHARGGSMRTENRNPVGISAGVRASAKRSFPQCVGGRRRSVKCRGRALDGCSSEIDAVEARSSPEGNVQNLCRLDSIWEGK